MMLSTASVAHYTKASKWSPLQNFHALHDDEFPPSVSWSLPRTLTDALHGCNNLSTCELVSGWTLTLEGSDVLGYIPGKFVDAAFWDDGLFLKDAHRRTIVLKANGKSIRDCNEAFIKFCEQNEHTPGFRSGLKSWLERKRRPDGKSLDYHPILTCDSAIDGLKVPSPIRGILGILTAGVHMNAYTVRWSDTVNAEIVDRIWVSQRGPFKEAYPSCFDQIVAGGMEPEDKRHPWTTLDCEAGEEAGYRREGNIMYSTRNGRRVGVVDDVFDTIYFQTQKDPQAGPAEDGHIEPGVRFCFDLKLDDGQEPVPNEGGMEFHSFSVEHVKETIKDGKWKPNSGLVMLNFLLRHGLVEMESDKRSIKQLSRQTVSLPIPEFPKF